MKRLLLLVCISLLSIPTSSCLADKDSLFFFFDPYEDPLSHRDEYGLLHQTPDINPTDLEPRHHLRLQYYFESGDKLTNDRAYVGAVQVALRDQGYYCGPIDGFFSDRVVEAIARMQKNYSLKVTGTLTEGVRRGLHLP